MYTWMWIHTNKIELTKDAGLVMTYSTMDMFMDVIYRAKSTDEMLDVISKCILQIYNGEEVYDKASTSDKDRKDFIENLTQEQFLKLQHFFKTMFLN